MITLEEAVPGTEVIVTGDKTTILTGHYVEERLGLMIKTAKYPGGYPADQHQLVNHENGVAVKEAPIVVFKGKLVGEADETVITPQLIEERSRPLLALKINGIFDNEGAEKVKEAITKAVKMRTLVEKQADPLMKSINARAKSDVQKVKDLAQPIYEACLKTQNALQATYDAWIGEVNKAKEAEQQKYLEKTEGRENKLFEMGMTWNGRQFSGYGKVIEKPYLFELSDERYSELVTELEGLQMQAGVTGKEAENPAPVQTSASYPGGYHPAQEQSAAKEKQSFPDDVIIYKCEVAELDICIYITNGQQTPFSDALVSNDEVNGSGYFVQVITR